MKHQTKTKIFKILSLLPNKIGDAVYHLLQRADDINVDKKIKSTNSSYQQIRKILEDNKISLNGKVIAEIGSGWVPILPYQMVLDGKAREVHTFDINQHYDKKQIREVNLYFKNNYDDFTTVGTYDLLPNINYFPKKNIVHADLSEVDIIISRFVLEHVPPDLLAQMHQAFFEKLKPASIILHLISPSDHRAYSDNSISLQDFLKYSEYEWNQIQTRFDYHNRMRLPHYLEMFSKHFEIVYFSHDQINPNSESYKKFKELKLHHDYLDYSDQELMAGSIEVLLRKK